MSALQAQSYLSALIDRRAYVVQLLETHGPKAYWSTEVDAIDWVIDELISARPDLADAHDRAIDYVTARRARRA